MTKIHKFFAVLIAAMLLAFICIGAGVPALAEEDVQLPEQETVQTPTEPEIESAPPEDNTDGESEDNTEDKTTEGGIDEIADSFMNYLKAKYGEDYEFYYSEIIDKWGSIEGYLLAFGNKLPEEQRTDWEKFVGWLNEYAPVWAVPLAILIVIIVAVVGKKAFNSAIERIVNGKLKPVVQELNLQSNATISLMRAQKALLGQVPKFSDNVKELEAAEKELADG